VLIERLSDTVAVTTPIFVGQSKPPVCEHEWRDCSAPTGKNVSDILLDLERCCKCDGTRARITAISKERMDEVLHGQVQDPGGRS